MKMNVLKDQKSQAQIGPMTKLFVVLAAGIMILSAVKSTSDFIEKRKEAKLKAMEARVEQELNEATNPERFENGIKKLSEKLKAKDARTTKEDFFRIMLSDPDPDVRIATISYLSVDLTKERSLDDGAVPDTESLQSLMQVLFFDNDKNVRCNAAVALGRMAFAASNYRAGGFFTEPGSELIENTFMDALDQMKKEGASQEQLQLDFDAFKRGKWQAFIINNMDTMETIASQARKEFCQ